MYAKHRRSAAIRLGLLFGILTVALVATDPVHFLDADFPARLDTPIVLNRPPPASWPVPRSPELAQRTRDWLSNDGNARLGRLTEDLITAKRRIRASRPRHIDWRSFTPDCTAVRRDLDALRALPAYPVPDVGLAWVTTLRQAANAVGTLCRGGYTNREFRVLIDAAGYAERAGAALNTVYAVLTHYLRATP